MNFTKVLDLLMINRATAKKGCLSIATYAIYLFCFTFSAQANEPPSLKLITISSHNFTYYQSDLPKLVELVEQGQCDTLWNILYDKASRGSTSASALLSLFLYTSITPPAINIDNEFHFESAQFFALHSIGVNADIFEDFGEFRLEVLDGLFEGEDSLQKLCSTGPLSISCIDLANKSGLVKSWDEYGTHIGDIRKQGGVARCIEER